MMDSFKEMFGALLAMFIFPIVLMLGCGVGAIVFYHIGHWIGYW